MNSFIDRHNSMTQPHQTWCAAIFLAIALLRPGLGQLTPAAEQSSPSVSDVVQGLLSSPVTTTSGVPVAPVNGSSPVSVAPAPAVVVESSSRFSCSDVLITLQGSPLSADTDAFLNAHRYVLQSLVYPSGLSVDTLQANYSLVAGVGQLDTINRFWLVNQQDSNFQSELSAVVGSGPASYLLGMQQKGFNVTLKVAGTNTTVQGLASDIPASSLQPVQPVYSTSLNRLNLTVQVQGAGVLPFSASLQRELVSALLHSGAAQGAVGVSIASYSQNGGTLMNPSLLPVPANQTSSTGRRSLLQAAAGMPYANANVQVLCQSCNDTTAMLAALNSSSPSLLFTASGTGATIVATSTLSAVTTSSAASSSGGHHSSGHAAAIAVPVVMGSALIACLAGCVWWSKKGNKGRQGQAVAKSASGVPFNTDLDSARGPAPEDVQAPKEVIIRPEPDHAPADGVRVGGGRVQRSWLHRLTATPMRTTSGQNWLQVMRTEAAHPKEGTPLTPHAPSPVPQLRVAGISGQNMEVDRVVARVRARENEQHDALSPVQTFVNAHMQDGMSFKGKYSMQSHGWPGPAYVLCSAQRGVDKGHSLSVKLFARGVDYLQEKALLETPTITLQEYLPGLSESYSATAGEFAGQACPPCLLIDRPACTLDHWLSNARAEATVPAWSDKVSTLYNVLGAVHSLHIHRVVHCDLQPIQFGWFNEQQQWKLLGLATWSHTGSARSGNMCYTLRYAAPEVVQGDQSGKEPPLATPAADVWALGVIAYEVLCGQRLFNQEMNQGEVVSMLLGYTPLPYEANPALFQSISAPPNAQSMLRQMLQRNPTARPALKDVLFNSLFAGLSKTQRVQSEREQSAQQIWSKDFKSQMSNALDSLDSVDIIDV
ncbi:TPA: hypothetical protein ACH3X3_008192 [Trebouxia sp. C0006]